MIKRTCLHTLLSTFTSCVLGKELDCWKGALGGRLRLSIRNGDHIGNAMEAPLNPSGGTVRLNWIGGKTRWVVTGPVNALGAAVETLLKPSGGTDTMNWIAAQARCGSPSQPVRTNWSAGKAPWGAGSLLLGKSGALERGPGALEASCLEKMERWKLTPFGALKI